MAAVEEKDVTDEATKAEEPKDETAKEALEVLAPLKEAKSWTFSDPESGMDRTYVQRPLSYFGKLELYSILGDAISKSMEGPDGLTIDGMVKAAVPVGMSIKSGGLAPNQIEEMDQFITGIAKLATAAPDIFLDLYCVFLAVPRFEREWAKDMMRRPPNDDTPSEGGLNDEEGFEILERFIDQNVEAIRDFFVRQGPRAGRRASQALGLGAGQESQSQKPSRATRRATRKV